MQHLPWLFKNAVNFFAVSRTLILHFAANEALDCGETETTTNFCSLGAAVLKKIKIIIEKSCSDSINTAHAAVQHARTSANISQYYSEVSHTVTYYVKKLFPNLWQLFRN